VRGGYGIVYLAEQQRPVKRRVALKVIKPGMDTKQVIARFEAERQALALLDHPNIAHVFNAGTTEAGRPYFAMEYVKGGARNSGKPPVARCRLFVCRRAAWVKDAPYAFTRRDGVRKGRLETEWTGGLSGGRFVSVGVGGWRSIDQGGSLWLRST